MKTLSDTVIEHLNRDYNVWSNSMVILINLAVNNKEDALLVCNKIGNQQFTELVEASYTY